MKVITVSVTEYAWWISLYAATFSGCSIWNGFYGCGPDQWSLHVVDYEARAIVICIYTQITRPRAIRERDRALSLFYKECRDGDAGAITSSASLYRRAAAMLPLGWAHTNVGVGGVGESW